MFKEKNNFFMRIFLIDFENVHNDGLFGIDTLTEDDEIVIFYSINADSISFEMLHKLMFCKAKLNYFKIRRGGKNALDFQLSSFLGYKLHENPTAEYFLISKDNGFDFVIDFWSYGYVDINPNIKRFATVKTVLNWLAGQSNNKLVAKANALQALEVLITERDHKLQEIISHDIAQTIVPVSSVAAEPVTEETKEKSALKTTKPSRSNTEKKPPVPSKEKIQSPVLTDEEAELKSEKPTKQHVQKDSKIKTDKAVKTLDMKNTGIIEKAEEELSVVAAEIQKDKEKDLIEITDADLNVIHEFMPKAGNTQELYIMAVKRFGQKKGAKVYKTVKAEYAASLKSARA